MIGGPPLTSNFAPKKSSTIFCDPAISSSDELRPGTISLWSMLAQNFLSPDMPLSIPGRLVRLGEGACGLSGVEHSLLAMICAESTAKGSVALALPVESPAEQVNGVVRVAIQFATIEANNVFFIFS